MERIDLRQKYVIPLRNLKQNAETAAASSGRKMINTMTSSVDNEEVVQAYKKTKYYTEDVVGILDMMAGKAAQQEIFNAYQSFNYKIMAADPKRVGKDFAVDQLTVDDYKAFKRLSMGPDYKYDRTQHKNNQQYIGGKKAAELKKYANFHTVEDDLRLVMEKKPDLFTDREKALLSQDNRIFEIKSSRDLAQLKTTVLKGLNSKGQAVFIIQGQQTVNPDWNKLKAADLKSLLVDRNINRDVKSYISVLAKIKETEEKIGKIKINKGQIKSMFVKSTGLNQYRDTDVGQGFAYVQKGITTGNTMVRVAKLSGRTMNAGAKATGRSIVKTTRKLGYDKAADNLSKVGSVLNVPEQAYKKIQQTPGRIMVAAEKRAADVAGRAGRQVAERMSRTAAGQTMTKVNKNVVKPITTGLDYMTKPIRKVSNAIFGTAGKGIAVLRKGMFALSIGVFGLLLILFIFMFFVLNNMNTNSVVAGVILDTKEHFAEYQATYNSMDDLYSGQLDARINEGAETTNTKGEHINYGSPDFDSDESDGSKTRNGITVKYLDAEGNPTASSANIEDILSIMAVVMNQSMAKDDYHYQAALDLIEAYYKSSHLYYVVESPLYPCEEGCIEIPYYCNDVESSDIQYNLYPDLELYEAETGDDGSVGCIGTDYCNGHTDRYTDPETGQVIIDEYECDGCKTKYHCSGAHSVMGCFGHVDLEMNFIVLGMQDLMVEDFEAVISDIQETYPGIKGADGTDYHNYVADWMTTYVDIASAFSAEGWSEDNIAWAESLRATDFNEYGIIASYVTQSILTPEDIEAIKEQLGDIDEVRSELVTTAYQGVGIIPYHWDWRQYDSVHPGIEDNRFGSSVPADYKGRSKKGLDCSGFVDWVYLTAGIDSFGTSATGGIWSICEQIRHSELQPGDLGFLYIPGSSAGTNHVGVYVGMEDGKEVWIHCSGSKGCNKAIGYNGFNYYCRYPALD